METEHPQEPLQEQLQAGSQEQPPTKTFDNKLSYVIKTLSRTRRKDWENYVVNAVWNRLGDWSVKPVSQQYINNKGKRYLIDLYFPQLNIGIECDEWHHSRQEDDDWQRELEIIDFLRQVRNPKDGSYEPIHIDASKPDFEGQINDCVAKLRDVVAEQKASGQFEEWADEVSPQEFYRDKTLVSVDDDVAFGKISDICNTLFGTEYKMVQDSHFVPWTFRERYGKDYVLWCPKLAIGGKAVARGWNNQISDDGLTICEFNQNFAVGDIPHAPQRVTFARVRDPITGVPGYRFFGVFKLLETTRDHKHVFVRQDDMFPIIKV
jgi:very-short-patch-repair endonuclease